MKKNETLSKIFKAAWAAVKTTDIKFAQALKNAWAATKAPIDVNISLASKLNLNTVYQLVGRELPVTAEFTLDSMQAACIEFGFWNDDVTVTFGTFDDWKSVGRWVKKGAKAVNITLFSRKTNSTFTLKMFANCQVN